MVKVSRESKFEWWDMQEDPSLKFFRSSAPPEDRALFLHYGVGPCFEEATPRKPNQSLSSYVLQAEYRWVSEWWDLEEMDLSGSEKLSMEAIDNLLVLLGRPAASKSWNRRTLFDCFELAHQSFSEAEGEILGLAKDRYIHEDESANILSSADGQIGRLGEWYELRDRPAIEDFLREDSSLFDLLEEARDKIREHFDPDTPVALDVLREPDAKSSGRLFVLILTELRPKEALSRLDELDQDWWLGALSAAQGKVTIDIDYG